jgi:general secretion pathway protein H
MTDSGQRPATDSVGRVSDPPSSSPRCPATAPARGAPRLQSAIGNRRSEIQGAFTLLEILLALALVALLAGALIGGSSALLADKPVSPDDVFWSTVRAARKSALNDQQDLNLRYDEKTKSFQLIAADGTARSFPIPVAAADLLVEFLAAQKTGGSILLGGTVVETEPLTGGVTFFADGTCTAFRLQIRANGGAHILAIDPWTCAPVIPPAPST